MFTWNPGSVCFGVLVVRNKISTSIFKGEAEEYGHMALELQ
jgi:hypothetical protein